MSTEHLRAALIKSSGILDDLTSVRDTIKESVAEAHRQEAETYATLRSTADAPFAGIGAALGTVSGATLGALPGLAYNYLSEDSDKKKRRARVVAGMLPGAMIGGIGLGSYGASAERQADMNLEEFKRFRPWL